MCRSDIDIRLYVVKIFNVTHLLVTNPESFQTVRSYAEQIEKLNNSIILGIVGNKHDLCPDAPTDQVEKFADDHSALFQVTR